jgi:hypothetical protein
MVDAKDDSISADMLWEQGDKQKAIALMAVRALILQKGSSFLGPDTEYIHGAVHI